LSGPAGSGDGYRHDAADVVGQDDKLIVFNESQWTGEYLSTGVTAISFRANIFSSVEQTFDRRVAIGSGLITSFPAASGT
jgi:hypothetical protein